jgi:hypothetical protein
LLSLQVEINEGIVNEEWAAEAARKSAAEELVKTATAMKDREAALEREKEEIRREEQAENDRIARALGKSPVMRAQSSDAPREDSDNSVPNSSFSPPVHEDPEELSSRSDSIKVPRITKTSPTPDNAENSSKPAASPSTSPPPLLPAMAAARCTRALHIAARYDKLLSLEFLLQTMQKIFY